MSGFQPKNNLGWIFVEIMLQPEINQNTTLKWRQVSNIKSTMVGFWLDFGCLTSQPDFNHGTTLKSGCVPSGKSDIGKLLEETTVGELNGVLGRISEHFYEHDVALDELRTSLEFSQLEIDDLKKENDKLKEDIKALKIEGRRNEFQIQDLDNNHERLDTQARKKNLVFEGVDEAKQGDKEDLQRLMYNIFDQMKIDHPIECDTCYRTGPYSRNMPRPIVISFLKQADRDHVFAKRVTLKTSRECSKVWVNEDLAPTARRAKTMVRLINRQAHEKGVPCRSSKFTVTVDNIKYNEDTLNPANTQRKYNVVQRCKKVIFTTL